MATTTTSTIGSLLVNAGQSLLAHAAALEKAQKGTAQQRDAARTALRTGLDQVMPILLQVETWVMEPIPDVQKPLPAAMQPTEALIAKAKQVESPVPPAPVLAKPAVPAPAAQPRDRMVAYLTTHNVKATGTDVELTARIAAHRNGKPVIPADPKVAVKPYAASAPAAQQPKPIPMPSVAQVTKPAATCPVPTRSGVPCKGKVNPETGKCATHSKPKPATAPEAPKTVTLIVDADKADALTKLSKLSAADLAALLELAAK